jgi:hypothetical protein
LKQIHCPPHQSSSFLRARRDVFRYDSTPALSPSFYILREFQELQTTSCWKALIRRGAIPGIHRPSFGREIARMHNVCPRLPSFGLSTNHRAHVLRTARNDADSLRPLRLRTIYRLVRSCVVHGYRSSFRS